LIDLEYLTKMKTDKHNGKEFICFGPKQDSEFLVGPNGIALKRRVAVLEKAQTNPAFACG